MHGSHSTKASLVAACLSVAFWGLYGPIASVHGAPSYGEALEKRFDRGDAQYLTDATADYYIAGTRIPDVTFDVGESYAGLMPVNASVPEDEMQKMFFWFFPTVNPAGKDDLVIWFNGGPGCSSLEGLLEENGPFLWKPGTFRPIENAYSWHKLANVIWVEYPIGTGFSSGPITALNNDDAAQQFVGFWRNFMDTFQLQGKKIYLTGESYAGVHVPYVGAAMLEQNDTDIFDVQGALFYDAVLPGSDGIGHDQRSLPAYIRHWNSIFGLPDSFKQKIEDMSAACGHDAYMQKYLSYPPPPTPWPAMDDSDCDVLTPFWAEVFAINPCFNEYHITEMCPTLWDVLGYPNFVYVAEGASIYWNDNDVRRLIHVSDHNGSWAMCQGPVYAGTGSDNYDNTEHAERLRTLVEHTNKVIIGSGQQDMVIQPNVTALAIQMFEWNGAQGFQSPPSDDLILPAAVNPDIPNYAGGGYQGTVHAERGLTHVTVNLAGHMVPEYTPSAAFRHLEYLLGRVGSLSSGEAFSVNISTSFTWPY